MIEGQVYVDGGIAANAPDLLLLTEAMRRFSASLSECHLLSVGTAGIPREGQAEGAPGRVGWIVRQALVDLMMSAQEAFAIEQVRNLRPGCYLRIDASPGRKIPLDDVSDPTSELLVTLAGQAVTTLEAEQASAWRRFLAHRPNGLG